MFQIPKKTGTQVSTLLSYFVDNVILFFSNFSLGSHKQMLDLVHPSLYCFVAGVSLESETPVHPPLKYIGGGKV
jgi:hypothetical protein